MKEQRRFSRVNFHAHTWVSHAGQRVDAELLDLSLRGALLAIDQVVLLQKGQVYPIEIQLGGSDIILKITAELVHIAQEHYGFRFQSIDLDSLAHLRRLMEMNLGDAEQVDRELFFLTKD